MILREEGFVLRPIRISDAKGYLECHKDNEAKKSFSSFPKNVKGAEKEIIEARKTEVKFVIIVDKEFAGFIYLRLTKIQTYKKFRKKGISTKSLKLVVNYGFNELELKMVVAWCRPFNKGSIRILEKAGFKLERILRKNKFKDGKYLDDMVWTEVR